MSPLADFTTLKVGGPAAELLEPTTPDELVAAARRVWDGGGAWLVLGGGSNVVLADSGFDGSVIRVRTRGIEQLATDADGRTHLRVQAGEPWDDLVAYAVAHGLAGIEALSGIPGSSGAAPIQNIGAYGQEIASALVAVDFIDAVTGDREWLSADELGLAYRTSQLKAGRRGLVVAIELALEKTDALSAPIAYPQLAGALGVELGARLPLADVRAAVLALRASKGMLLNPDDPDSVSVGSFFTNPIVSDGFARGLPTDAPRWPVSLDGADDSTMDDASAVDRTVKLSAAWLIEHSGITRGFRLPGSRIAVSSKHTLAIVNTGGGTAAEVGELARYIQTRVLTGFGVILQPEPILVGVEV
ncbi:UDP-N-acetylmuramate dehydrogenase [Lacisediminihabitans changchengi]|uniref:UDP-N-acetylenolpyruvoylglucosamine reductase n=1 Tax=Lacisediminihabitans changchengi TaxID=2787634 RepID=A0A934SU89_9MICO|nr:UDP-N-acetylmuramate dehydrogenase [Lacisediminihabitans changchengi]MBK4349073.1 UDP-N-acetylmuramate dehydrogenase [Lacisediminihabitans changchengi]